jgi:tetratricopeptide (TPR) repeat protein
MTTDREDYSSWFNRPWEHLRKGEPSFALAELKERYLADKKEDSAARYAIALMWAGEYGDAAQYLQEALAKSRAKSEGLFSFAGIAAWCSGNPAEAVRFWKLGLKARYAPKGATTHSAMLLYLASILRPGTLLPKDALELMKKKSEDPKVNDFPGILAKYITGTIDEVELCRHWVGIVAPSFRRMRLQAQWLTAFYQRITDLQSGSMSRASFQDSMAQMTGLNLAKWGDIRDFVSLIWSPEFYIARTEALTLASTPPTQASSPTTPAAT